MLKGHCLCGAVSFECRTIPRWLVDCNCMACRRYGTLWAHAKKTDVTLNYRDEDLISFQRNEKMLTFHSCKICGCTTHWSSVDPSPDAPMAINCHLVDPQDLKGIRVQHFDGLESWSYLD